MDWHHPERLRAGRLHWAVLAFLLGFTVLLVVVGYFYLAPGAVVLGDESTPETQRRTLRAVSSLLLAVMLIGLVLLMLIVFRVRRFFFDPRPRTQTQYPDAWAESARRVRVSDDDADDDHTGDNRASDEDEDWRA